MSIKIDNDKKITAKTVNLTFTVKEGVDLKELDFNDVKDTIKENLKSKGVILSPKGQSVEVRINNFQLWDNVMGKHNNHSNTITGGIGDAVGLGLATRVVGTAVENKVTNAMTNNKDVVCKSSSCAPEVGFSIISNNYQANVDLRVVAPYSNHYYGTEGMLSNTISEFFEPK